MTWRFNFVKQKYLRLWNSQKYVTEVNYDSPWR